MSRALLTIIVATAVSSCVTESGGPPALRETLPNGALLVRYPDLPAIDDTVPEVTEANVDLRLGSIDGEDLNLVFGAIRGVQAASDGTIYVLDQQASEVRVFDSGGQYLRTIVRQGEGPGEIAAANGIFLSGDTLLWVHDTGQWRVIGVDPTGVEVRRFLKPVMSYTYIWNGTFDNLGRYWKETSQIVGEASFPPPMGLSYVTQRHYFKSYDLSTAATDSVYFGEVTGRSYAYSTPEILWGFLDIRFEASEPVVVNPSGGFWRAKTAEYRIARTTEDADTLVVIEAGLPVQPVTDEDRAAYVEEYLEFMPELRREAEEVAALLPDVKPVRRRRRPAVGAKGHSSRCARVLRPLFPRRRLPGLRSPRVRGSRPTLDPAWRHIHLDHGRDGCGVRRQGTPSHEAGFLTSTYRPYSRSGKPRQRSRRPPAGG
ncbi:MAG: 6-bladed beta-propeller [Gemmatimonadetes bacterium]|nr:6-bladed beta-propeller [Gemmatimonadota bacterium]